jgi:hypothetical protein
MLGAGGREAAVARATLRPPVCGSAKSQRLEQAHQSGGHAQRAAGCGELATGNGQQPKAQYERDNGGHMHSFLFGRRREPPPISGAPNSSDRVPGGCHAFAHP